MCDGAVLCQSGYCYNFSFQHHSLSKNRWTRAAVVAASTPLFAQRSPLKPVHSIDMLVPEKRTKTKLYCPSFRLQPLSMLILACQNDDVTFECKNELIKPNARRKPIKQSIRIIRHHFYSIGIIQCGHYSTLSMHMQQIDPFVACEDKRTIYSPQTGPTSVNCICTQMHPCNKKYILINAILM